MRNLFILTMLMLGACTAAVNTGASDAKALCAQFTASGATNALVQGACLDVTSITPDVLAVIEAAVASLPVK